MQKEFKCSVRKHSKKQLEIKLTYPLSQKSKKTFYNVNLYFFFPSQLHINEKRIGIANFINNMQINDRFSSPLMPLERVLESENMRSPIIRIKNMINNDTMDKKELGTSITYELQTLCNLYKAEIKNFTRLIKTEIKKTQWEEIYKNRIREMLTTVDQFLTKFRELHITFLHSHIHEDQRVALNWADESISIISENNFINLLEQCKCSLNSQDLQNELKEFIKQEIKYRDSMNCKYRFDESDPLCGEAMAYRESILKKWYQSSMYLNNENSQAPKRIYHLIAGTAAGLAMALALFISIYAESYFPKNSTYMILILVLSYILKDRIKEMLKDSFGSMLPKWATDQQSNLYDPALESKIGKTSGTIKFGTSKTVPHNIYSIRYNKPNPFRKILPPNDTIHYKRVIKLNSKLLKKNHSRLESISEIIRFQVDDWLKEMDDSKGYLYHMVNGSKTKISGGRVYHIHLIVALERDKNYHFKLILNKSGIVRIERK